MLSFRYGLCLEQELFKAEVCVHYMLYYPYTIARGAVDALRKANCGTRYEYQNTEIWIIRDIYMT